MQPSRPLGRDATFAAWGPRLNLRGLWAATQPSRPLGRDSTFAAWGPRLNQWMTTTVKWAATQPSRPLGRDSTFAAFGPRRNQWMTTTVKRFSPLGRFTRTVSPTRAFMRAWPIGPVEVTSRYGRSSASVRLLTIL